MTPHDTGKVRIGSAYVPPPPANDPDMERLQTALRPPLNRRNLWRELIRDTLMLAMFTVTMMLIAHAPQLWNRFIN